MSIIKEVKEKLNSASGPVARSLHQGEGFRVLTIGFNAGMIMKEHKASISSKLTVLEGSVVYQEANRAITLSQYEEIDIPILVIHSVEALEDSLCLLTQGNSTKSTE